jgi:hypothetical protein
MNTALSSGFLPRHLRFSFQENTINRSPHAVPGFDQLKKARSYEETEYDGLPGIRQILLLQLTPSLTGVLDISYGFLGRNDDESKLFIQVSADKGTLKKRLHLHLICSFHSPRHE